MASERFSDDQPDQPAYVLFLLLLLAEIIAGVFLYVVFLFVPRTVEVLIVVASWAVAVVYRFEAPKSKSLASLLGAITGGLTALCAIALRIPRLRITHEDVLFRLTLVGI